MRTDVGSIRESRLHPRVREGRGHLSPHEVDVDGHALVHLLVHALLLFLPRRRLRHGGGEWNNKRPRLSNRLRTHVYVVIMCAGCAHKRVRAQRIVTLIIITSDHILVIHYDDKCQNDSTATTKQLTSIINVRVQGFKGSRVPQRVVPAPHGSNEPKLRKVHALGFLALQTNNCLNDPRLVVMSAKFLKRTPTKPTP